jgi:hypothetical protein
MNFVKQAAENGVAPPSEMFHSLDAADIHIKLSLE